MDTLIGAKILGCEIIVVVPLKFIHKLDLVKTLNNSVNHNQQHLMFWSEDQSKKPNFSLPISDRFSREVDSCHNVKLLKAFRNNEEWTKFTSRRCARREPPLYNERRLREKPYPVQKKVIVQGAQKPTKPPQKVTRQKEVEQKRSNRLATVDDLVDVLIDTPPNSPVSSSTHDEVPIDPPTNTQIMKSTCNDVICLSQAIHFQRHKPVANFDVVSGRYPFTVKEQDRVYYIMGKRFILKKDTINRLLYYNKSPNSKNNVNMDKVYVDLLLLSAFNVTSLKRFKLDPDILSVIKDFYKIRVDGNKDRLAHFGKYVHDKCLDLRRN